MSALVPAALFWLLAATAVTGALTVVMTRDVMRMALGLGALLLAVAGFFAYYGFGFLALAELFVYVGGVLVLVLFAIMLVHRSEAGSPALESRHSFISAIAAGGMAALVFAMVEPIAGAFSSRTVVAGPAALAKLLLGPMVVQFELAGALLLAALVAVVAIVGGERE